MQSPLPTRYQAVGVLYENVDWLEDLFTELERRGVPYRPIYVDDAAFALDCPIYSLVIGQ